MLQASLLRFSKALEMNSYKTVRLGRLLWGEKKLRVKMIFGTFFIHSEFHPRSQGDHFMVNENLMKMIFGVVSHRTGDVGFQTSVVIVCAALPTQRPYHKDAPASLLSGERTEVVVQEPQSSVVPGCEANSQRSTTLLFFFPVVLLCSTCVLFPLC